MRLLLPILSFLTLVLVAGLAGCRPSGPEVVVYAAQDRVFAQPILEEFTRRTGIRVRAVYDNEATKTVGLANRIAAEAGRPLADVWWSNEEMRTLQLARQRVLEADPTRFGARHRVLVCHSNQLGRLPPGRGMALLTNAELKGRLALAYPVFGSTATHLLVLRQRWGIPAWEAWCRALVANRPLLVDGNSTVVKLVAGGQALVGLTDSDDVAAARREGWPVVALELEEGARLVIPNSIARVTGAPRPDEATRLLEYLGGPDVRRRLADVGAIDPDSVEASPHPSDDGAVAWGRLLDELDAGVDWLRRTFLRNG